MVVKGNAMRAHPTPTAILAAILAATLALGLATPLVAAHASKTSTDGAIKVTWGWLDEPATTEAKNGLDIAFRYASNNSGVMGVALEPNLRVSLHYGDEELVLDGIQAQRGLEAEGRYTALHPITPSQPGLYVLHIVGSIQGSTLDLEIPATHETPAIEETYFPAEEPEDDTTRPPATFDNAENDARLDVLEAKVAALEAKVAALESDARTQATTPATLTPQPTPTSADAVPSLGAAALVAVLGVVALAAAIRRR